MSKREHSTVWIRKHARYFRAFVDAVRDMYGGSISSVDMIISAARLAKKKGLPAKKAGDMFALGLEFGADH